MDVGAAVDQRAVVELVEHYESKASAVSRAGIGVGGFLGGLFGAVPLTPLDFVLPIPSSFGLASLLLGVTIGLLAGFVIGDSRARMYHRMAEQARLQLDLEDRLSRSDARMAQLVAALTQRAQAARGTAAPAPAPAPAPASPVLAQPALAAPHVVLTPAPALLEPQQQATPVPPLVRAVQQPAPLPQSPPLLRPTTAPPASTPPPLPPVLTSVPSPPPEPPQHQEDQQQLAASGGEAFPAPPLSPPISR